MNDWAWYSTPIIPTTQEVEIGKVMVQGKPRQKASKTPVQQTSWVWWLTSTISAIQEAAGGRIIV
jgi:hypothetical protein